jgi:hypothetical protein
VSARRRWHVGDWGRLGAVETAVKGVAFLCAYLAIAGAAGSGRAARRGAVLGEVALLVLAEAGLLIAIADRWMEREITAMIFIVFNNLAHCSMIAALLTADGPGALLPAFAGLMLAGELVKIRFLRSTGFTVRGHPPALLVAGVAGYAALYGAVLVLSVL